jgi:hypothetical protein
MRTLFALPGTPLALDHDDATLVAPLMRFLAGFEADALAAPPVTWRLATGSPDDAPDLPLLYEGPMLPSGIGCIYRSQGERRFLAVPGRLSIDSGPDGRTGSVVVGPDGLALLSLEFGMMILAFTIWASGQTMIHAAALRLPDRDSAILIVAPSGAGKTTTSIALALQGFALLSDDAAVASRGPDGGWRVWGVPRPLKVHHRTAALFPELAAALTGTYDGNGEQPLRAEAVPALAGAMPGIVLPVAAIVHLRERRREGPTAVPALAKPEMLVALAADNLRHSHKGTPGDQLAAFGVLAALVRDRPTFALHVGDDLRAFGPTILAALGPP